MPSIVVRPPKDDEHLVQVRDMRRLNEFFELLVARRYNIDTGNTQFMSVSSTETAAWRPVTVSPQRDGAIQSQTWNSADIMANVINLMHISSICALT